MVVPRDPTTIDGTPPDKAFPSVDWIGPFPAVVVDTKDPEKRGRIRARAPQVWGDTEAEEEFIPDADLPWAVPQFPAHDLHVPEVGDGVVLQFWGGSASEPVWVGQYLGDGDAPEEFETSYTPEPKTRIIRTANGHTIEMRWVEGQQRITLTTQVGNKIDLVDFDSENPASPGPKIEVVTPAQQRIEIADLPAPTIKIISTGQVDIQGTGPVNVQSGALLSLLAAGGLTMGGPPGVPMSGATNIESEGALNVTYKGVAALTFLASLAITAATTLALGATTGISILLSAAVSGGITLGAAGTFYRLLDERFVALFDAHTHQGVTPGPGNSGVPTTLLVPSITTFVTDNTRAN
jgi:hypothetical protein